MSLTALTYKNRGAGLRIVMRSTNQPASQAYRANAPQVSVAVWVRGYRGVTWCPRLITSTRARTAAGTCPTLMHMTISQWVRVAGQFGTNDPS